MDFKIRIECCVCHCSFDLRPGSYQTRDKIACPNCGNQLPAEVVRQLNIGIEALANVPAAITDNDEVGILPKYFKLEVVTFNDFIATGITKS